MRRGVLWGGLLLGCSFEAASVGSDSATDSGLGGTTTSSTTGAAADPSAGTQVGTGTSSSTTSGDAESESASASASASAGSESDTTTTTTTTATASSDSTSSSGEQPERLSEVGLVARYFLDEADAGTVPQMALDSAEDPLPLPLEYVERTMHYASAFGHRGLAFDLAGADDGARAPVAGSKFGDLDGGTELTYEVVVRLDDAVSSDSRLVHLGRPDSGTATLSSDDPDQLQFVWNDTIVREWDYSAFNDGVAHVLHVIVDTSAGSDASRVRLLVDGDELTPNILAALEQGEPASVPPDAIFALGNRNGDRAMEGILFYVAIYELAMPDATIFAHVLALIENSDSPG